MKTLTPLHSRANVIPRPELAAALSDLMHQGGEIKTDLFGTLRIDCSVKYRTPAPRNSFAFGQVHSMGLPARDFRIGEHPGVMAGSIIGFDLHQTGHEIGAQPFHGQADTFYTLPWKEIACVFEPGADLPLPVGWWLMVSPDEVMTQRLVLGSRGSGLIVPGSAMAGGVATNKGKGTKVRLRAARVMTIGGLAQKHAADCVHPGSWVLYNPMDAIDVLYTKGADGRRRELAFLKWDDLEQVVEDDAG